MEEKIYDTAFELVSKLKENQLKVIVAESCTGGLIAAAITSVPGASKVIEESLIVYSDEIKHKRLGVSNLTLNKFGAVSEETAIEMKGGIAKYSYNYNNITLGIAVTGIAGPDGGTKDKPVGTVHIAVGFGIVCFQEKYSFSGDRNFIRNKACLSALQQGLLTTGLYIKSKTKID